MEMQSSASSSSTPLLTFLLLPVLSASLLVSLSSCTRGPSAVDTSQPDVASLEAEATTPEVEEPTTNTPSADARESATEDLSRREAELAARELTDGDVVLVKGSRSVGLELVADELLPALGGTDA